MSDKRYFDLTIPAPRRLALMRQAFTQHAAKYPHCPEHAKPDSWRQVRAYRMTSWRAAFCAGLNPGLNDGAPVWYAHDGAQFRGEQFADEILSTRGRGYYTDSDAYATARGIVGRLPHGRFIAGYFWSDNGERVYFPDIFDDADDAAHFADGRAERFADQSREDSYRYNEARDLETKIEDGLTRLRECIALRHRACMEYVREEAREIIETIRQARETLRTDYADFI